MNLADERWRALQHAEDFLNDLINPRKTPRVPVAVRKRAARLLRHYPGWFERREMLRESDTYLEVSSRLSAPDPLKKYMGKTRG
jgi:hypothetical protein